MFDDRDKRTRLSHGDELFQHALATAGDDRLFQNVPVDWWDATARVWRPSVLELRVAGGTHAEIIVPGPADKFADVAYESKPVAIAELRPSRLIDEAIAQFFTTRYTLELIETLMPCVDYTSDDERHELDRILNELLDTYVSGYESWRAAYASGSRDGGAATKWREYAVDARSLPRHVSSFGAGADIFSAVERDQDTGAIDCAPVALWDESARIWRPTMMLGATGDAHQFSARARVEVLAPGNPVDVVLVPGSLLQPLDIADTCFSLIAVPVLARDYLRLHDALCAAGFEAADAVAHPFVIAFARMLTGAAEEWRAVYEDGLVGAPPEPRVIPLPPSVWGMTSGIEAVDWPARG